MPRDLDTTSQQRAAYVTYHLILRALEGLEGLTTRQIAGMLGLSRAGASKLMKRLQAGQEPTIDYQDGRWIAVPYTITSDPAPATYHSNKPAS